MPDEIFPAFVESRMERVCESCGQTVVQTRILQWNETQQRLEVVKRCICDAPDDTGEPYEIVTKVDLEAAVP